MKRFAALILVLTALAMLLCSCYPGDAEYYESRFDELDISGRINEIAFKIEKDRVNDLLYHEIDVLIDDLSHINTHKNPTVKNINSEYISCVRILRASAERRQEGNRRYDSLLNMARSKYISTTETLNLAKKNEREDAK